MRHPLTPLLRAPLPVLLVFALGAFACTGTIDDPAANPRYEIPELPPRMEIPSVDECAEMAADTAVSGVRRLTREQYNNSVRDLFGDGSRPADSFFVDSVSAGYATNITGAVAAVQLENYLLAAESIAASYVDGGLASAISCDRGEEACARSFIQSMGRRAYRRPLTSEMEEELLMLYTLGRDGWGADQGFRMVVQGMLMSPHFLYLVEEEPGGAEDVTALGDYELATRLSYFLWNTTPDEALLDAAGAGELQTAEGLEAQAARLMANHERFTDALESFHFQWLGLDILGVEEKDTDVFPTFDAAQADSVRRSARAFVGHVFNEDDARLETLLTASYGFVDSESASTYGVSAPAGDGMTLVDFDPAVRAGILTQPRTLAAHAHQAEVSWVSRGLLVRHQLLCQHLPDPPADVSMDSTLDPNRVSNPDCRGCHTLIDPVGQAFDHFDATGAYREMHADGRAIDAAGDLRSVEGVEPAFDGAAELAEKLSTSVEVRACVARQWFRYAMARDEMDQDACSLATIEDRFAQSDYNLRELMLGIVGSESFRLRRRSEGE